MNLKDVLLQPILGTILKPIFWGISRTRLPQSKGLVSVSGLTEPVEILRDRWGVAHIYARSETDVLFGQGFVHAQERLWQMDFIRRVVSGRLAEILGEAGLPFDRVMRTLSLRRTAELEAGQAAMEMHALLDAYCAGANTWIERAINKHKLPLEFMLLGYQPEPWQRADITSWAKLMCWTLAGNLQSEFYRGEIVRRLGAEKTASLELDIERAWAVIMDIGNILAGEKIADATRAITGPHAGEGVGSNNWVVHGSRTVSGKPLLANDMHLELSAPAIWYENHLVGGSLEASGVSFPGVPLVVAGHNRSVAWGFTDACPDAQDLYEEHLRRSDDGGWEYEFRGQWSKSETRHEQIKVKGGKVVTEEVISTHHGPIINALFRDAFPDAPPLALRWTALDPSNALEAFYQMNMADNCAQIRKALRKFSDPSQNVVYADVFGSIGYTMNGRIPIRARGDGSVPVPGWTGEYEWVSDIPFDSMPHLENPPAGFIATANNQPNLPDFPYFLGKDFLISERAGRIVELLEARSRVDVAYFKKMQFDQNAISARLLGWALSRLDVLDPDIKVIVDGMRDWDGELAADSALACVFEATARQAVRLLLEHWLGDLGVRIHGKGLFTGQWPDHTWEWFVHLLEQPESPWFDLGEGEQRDDVLSLALRQGVDFLKKELGSDWTKWKWGRLHRLTLGHVLGGKKPLDLVFNLGPFPIGGDATTIWAAVTAFASRERRSMVGPPFRFIADLSDLDHCLSLLIPGQSGHLASRHYRDGIKPWFEGEYHPMLFNRDEVEQNLEARLVLEPLADDAEQIREINKTTQAPGVA
jgi:penicillin G amidase